MMPVVWPFTVLKCNLFLMCSLGNDIYTTITERNKIFLLSGLEIGFGWWWAEFTLGYVLVVLLHVDWSIYGSPVAECLFPAVVSILFFMSSFFGQQLMVKEFLSCAVILAPGMQLWRHFWRILDVLVKRQWGRSLWPNHNKLSLISFLYLNILMWQNSHQEESFFVPCFPPLTSPFFSLTAQLFLAFSLEIELVSAILSFAICRSYPYYQCW